MKRKMNEIIGLLRRGDIDKIATAAKRSPSLVSNIIHGRNDIESYPEVSKAMIEYVKRREQELTESSKLDKAAVEVYSKLKLKVPTNEELILRNLNAQKVSRLNRAELIYLIQEKRLRIKMKDFDDDDELRKKVIQLLKLEKPDWWERTFGGQKGLFDK